GGGGGWKDDNDQHRIFAVMMATIVSRCGSPALLEETLRPLGKAHYNRGVKESYYRSLEKALVEALGEVLGPDAFPPPSKAAWMTFVATVSECMMLAGDGVAPRQQGLMITGRKEVKAGLRSNGERG
ncbi:unnamed protein product, partial [Discosporangium mesarthrocarpum]